MVINPGFILGPALLDNHKNATSVSLFASIFNKTYPGVPKISLPVCDVRDAAKAHIQVRFTKLVQRKLT